MHTAMQTREPLLALLAWRLQFSFRQHGSCNDLPSGHACTPACVCDAPTNSVSYMSPLRDARNPCVYTSNEHTFCEHLKAHYYRKAISELRSSRDGA